MDSDIWVIPVLAALFFAFIGFLAWTSDNKMEVCITHGGSWVEGNCLIDKEYKKGF